MSDPDGPDGPDDPEHPGRPDGRGHPRGSSPADERWDAALLAAGFEVDPDAGLGGRSADELAVTGDDRSLPDPWQDAATVTAALTEDQRAYVIAASPALGAELPGQSLTGGDPFADVDVRAVRDADDRIIDFD